MSNDDPTLELPTPNFAEQARELTSPLYELQKRLQQFELQVAAIPKIEEQVAALDDKLDRRLHDTRPIWEGVLLEMGDLRATMGKEIENIKRRIGLLIQDNFEMRAAYRDLEKRVESLELGQQTTKQ
jgi:hypothetical protein